MAFVYQLSYFTRTKVVYPVAIGKIVVEREEDEMFFREKMNGNLSLIGEDFLFLKDAEKFNVNCCQEITLVISTVCGNEQKIFWQGYFNLLDIEWDFDNFTATIGKVNVKDPYDVVFRNWHIEVNWLDFTEYNLWGYQGEAVVNPEYNPNNSRVFIGRSFINALRWLIQFTFQNVEAQNPSGATATTLSKFLSDDLNPVTGRANIWKEVLLAHISDAKRPGATNPATKAIVTLKDVLSELKKLANLYWYIDPEDGLFKIEHKIFFNGLPENLTGSGYVDLVQTLDLTQPSFKETMKGVNQYKTNTGSLKGIEGLVMSMNRTVFDNREVIDSSYLPSEEFSNAYMSYSSNCVPLDDKGQRTEEIKTVSIFMTDFYSCLYYPEAIQDEGFLLVQTRWTDGVNDVVSNPTGIKRTVIRNGGLSASRLYRDYGLFDCSFSYGVLSTQKEGSTQTDEGGIQIAKRAVTTKNVRQYKEVELSNCCGDNYDFSGYIKHPLFDKCLIDRLEIDTLQQVTTASIVSVSPCSTIPIPDDEDEGGGDPDCPPYGQFLRREIRMIYYEMWTGEPIGHINMFLVYGDGNCGEYEVGPFAI